MTTGTTAGVGERVDALDWAALREQLDTVGHAVTAPLLDADECAALADLFDGGRFRSTIDMARHRFGDGRYRYFDHPLPDAIAALRTSFYRAPRAGRQRLGASCCAATTHVPARARRSCSSAAAPPARSGPRP